MSEQQNDVPDEQKPVEDTPEQVDQPDVAPAPAAPEEGLVPNSEKAAEPEVLAPELPEEAESDDSDVDEALKRETQDGSGLENDNEDELPEPDFDSFAGDDVEAPAVEPTEEQTP